MNNIPIPVRKLCLTIQFDLSECENALQLPSRDHDDALKQAAKVSGLFAPEAVMARSVTVPGDLTIAAAQDVEFDALAASGEEHARRPVSSRRTCVIKKTNYVGRPRVEG